MEMFDYDCPNLLGNGIGFAFNDRGFGQGRFFKGWGWEFAESGWGYGMGFGLTQGEFDFYFQGEMPWILIF
jgi:hypothetical protein